MGASAARELHSSEFSEREWTEAAEQGNAFFDIAKTLGILAAVTLVSLMFDALGFSEVTIVVTYVLGVLLTAIVTPKRIYCFLSSVVSVLAFNFFFTTPRYSFQAWGKEYPGTFAVMFVVAFVASWLTMQLREQARCAAAASRRTQVLLDCDQLLQACRTSDEIVNVMCRQLIKLLGYDVTWLCAAGKGLAKPKTLRLSGAVDTTPLSPSEQSCAQWVFEHNKCSGATTSTSSEASCLYLTVRTSDVIFGVVGIHVGHENINSDERSIVLSIIGETALALERDRALAEREAAAVLAKNEQLRANLLRSISHDLRTPLTAISGNADILLSEDVSIEKADRRRLLADIYDDAQWLTNLVENLLAATKLENGTVRLNLTCEAVDDMIEEALRHVSREARSHQIQVVPTDDILLVRADGHLVVQVIVNLINNAITHTPAGSHIVIAADRNGDFVRVSIRDDGPGIPDAEKERVFESFYTINHGQADSHRSMGLGLFLCRSIVEAHGGTIYVTDSHPHGCVFVFTLPAEEIPRDDAK